MLDELVARQPPSGRSRPVPIGSRSMGSLDDLLKIAR